MSKRKLRIKYALRKGRILVLFVDPEQLSRYVYQHGKNSVKLCEMKIFQNSLCHSYFFD